MGDRFRAECKVPGCDWATEAVLQDIAGCAATWHIWEEHTEAWVQAAGDRPPIDPDPRTVEGLSAIIRENIDRLNGEDGLPPSP